MFLDDKLLEIGRICDPYNDEQVIEAIDKMIKACFDHISTSVPEKGKDNIINVKAAFNRVNIVWQKVAQQLREEKRGIIKDDGWENYVKSKPEFEGIF